MQQISHFRSAQVIRVLVLNEQKTTNNKLFFKNLTTIFTLTQPHPTLHYQVRVIKTKVTHFDIGFIQYLYASRFVFCTKQLWPLEAVSLVHTK